jgi:hypothetical protein
MNTQAVTTIRTARTLAEADLLIASLRAAGLHPVELSTYSHFSLAGVEIEYPIRVQTDEAQAAKELLNSYDTSTGDT